MSLQTIVQASKELLDEKAAAAVLDVTPDPQADTTVTLSRTTLDDISLQRLTFAEAAQAGRLVITGQPQLLLELMAMLDRFSRMFPVVGPRPAAAQGLALQRGLG
jgi:alkyl sulfatase BDS1-like metallo-beta-lactamase superfamily hydrolase